MTTMRKIGVAVAILIALLVAFGILYAMPRASVVMITQTEVQRREVPSSATSKSRDMLLIYATDYQSKKPLVFRNEDNLFYFKVDSSDVASQAARFAKDSTDKPVLIRYYGVRIPIFSAYPNAISMKEVPADYAHIPWVSVLYLLVVLALFLWAGVKIRKLFRTAKDKVTNRPASS
jgi:archaellum component FlaF (FlaF/FlaG flagellin family)